MDLVKEACEIAWPLIQKYEGFSSKPYLDSVSVPTIGYGSTFYPDGRKVTLQDTPISKETATVLLKYTIQKIYLPAVLSLCPTLETPHQIAAILSWTYNLGPTNLRSSTLRKKILAKKWDEVPKELLKWSYAKGKFLQGLANRRSSEALIFLT